MDWTPVARCRGARCGVRLEPRRIRCSRLRRRRGRERLQLRFRRLRLDGIELRIVRRRPLAELRCGFWWIVGRLRGDVGWIAGKLLLACGVGTSGSATNQGRDASANPGFEQDSAGGGNPVLDSSAVAVDDATTVSPPASPEADVDGLADYAVDATPDSPRGSAPDAAADSVGNGGDGDAAGFVDAPEGDVEAGTCVSGEMRCNGPQPPACAPGGFQNT